MVERTRGLQSQGNLGFAMELDLDETRGDEGQRTMRAALALHEIEMVLAGALIVAH
jgi:hypothetical protein